MRNIEVNLIIDKAAGFIWVDNPDELLHKIRSRGMDTVTIRCCNESLITHCRKLLIEGKIYKFRYKREELGYENNRI